LPTLRGSTMTGLEDKRSKCPRCGAKMRWTRDEIKPEMKWHVAFVRESFECAACGYSSHWRYVGPYGSTLRKVILRLRTYYYTRIRQTLRC
jgi:transposase-like protein